VSRVSQAEVNVLDVKMNPEDNSAGAESLREYLQALLRTMWREGEEFSGKRPFGDSGWQDEVYRVLVAEGLVDGLVDEFDGDLLRVDTRAADALVDEAIGRLR
jgi:hypothetical protein